MSDIDPIRVLDGYINELANMTRRALIAEAAVAQLQATIKKDETE